MRRQSFARWHVPAELDGGVLLEDHARPGGRFALPQRHMHEELELHFVERGRGILLLGEERVAVPQGTLVVIPPQTEHLLLEATRDFRRYLLLCRKRAVRRSLPASACPRLIGRGARAASRLLGGRARSALRHTLAEVETESRVDGLVINAGVAYALVRSWRAFETGSGGSEAEALHPTVAAALHMLREGRMSVPQIAERAHVSASHLSKLFHAQVGTSITDFRNRVAIERFVELYGDGSKITLLAAAIDAGFGSYSQFHRVFRKQMGCSPVEHHARASIPR